jgi:hypothetical protein
MATSSTYYIDTADFSTATAVWTDTALTTKAPDGYYSFGGNYRQQFEGLLTAIASCTIPTTAYCYDGYWELDDPVHPGGGSVTYINNLGVETTINQIWLGYPVNFEASSIVSIAGCAPCV